MDFENSRNVGNVVLEENYVEKNGGHLIISKCSTLIFLSPLFECCLFLVFTFNKIK